MRKLFTAVVLATLSGPAALASEVGFNSISFGADSAATSSYVGTAYQLDETYRIPVRVGFAADDQENRSYIVGTGVAKSLKKTEHLNFSAGSTFHYARSESRNSGGDQRYIKAYLEVELRFSEIPNLGFNMQGGVYYNGASSSMFAVYNEAPFTSGFTYYF